MPRLDDFRPLVGQNVLEELRTLAKPLRGRPVVHVNSTAVGGGVAEILNRLVPLMQELEIPTRWELVKGGDAFFAVTKKFHNALHGTPQDVTPKDYQVYEETLDTNLAQMNLEGEVMFIHDPQPAGLVKKRPQGKARWLWRCHIDISRPAGGVWEFLKPYVEEYDACVISAPPFAQTLSIPQAVIAPSIDPLSDKNRELEPAEIDRVLDTLQIPRDKPLVTQISRFDRLKDPVGVIDAFQLARKYVDARLVLLGGTADDDPEGAEVLAEVRERARKDPLIHILCLPPTSHVEVNAVQRASTLLLQKSLKEGFGLTVSEALWKGKPVIAGAVGGIPLQILHQHTGVLVHSIPGTARWIRQLLTEPGFARRLGQNGREHVRQNFLLTRQLRDDLLLFLSVMSPGEDIVRVG